MSAGIVSNVFQHSTQKSTKRLIMVILAESANPQGVATLRNEEIAQFANIDMRRVTVHIGGLESAGELFVYRREGLHNVYVVLPGMTVQQRTDAIRFVNTQFRPETPITLDDLPLTVPSGVTPDGSIGGDGINGGVGPLTVPSGVPLTDESGPPDGSIGGYKDSVVVEKLHDSDQPNQQQQGDPPAPIRQPSELEKTLFGELHISESIWQLWMHREPVDVIAAYLHVVNSDGIENPLGLMRAMLEQDKGAPKRKFVEMAKRAIEIGSLDVVDQDEVNDRGLTEALKNAQAEGFATVEEWLSERAYQQLVVKRSDQHVATGTV